MNYQFVIGMDISKHSFDVAVFSADNTENVSHKSFTNDENGFKELLVFLTEASTEFDISKSIFCMEATGLYCNAL